jgi:hypothetical protein
MIRSERGSERLLLVLGRSDRKKAPSFLFSRSRGLALLLFGCFPFGLSSPLLCLERNERRSKRTQTAAGDVRERNRTIRHYPTLGERRRRLVAWACSFLLWVGLVTYYAHPAGAVSAASTGLSSLLVATTSVHIHRLPQLSLGKCG